MTRLIDDILKPLGGAVLGGVETVGSLMDLPASSVRDLLALRNPLDQWIHPFTPEKRTSGRELLERWDLLGRNRPGLDMGDVLGFGVEVLLDPLVPLSIGKLTKVGERLARQGAPKETIDLGLALLAGKAKDLPPAEAAKLARDTLLRQPVMGSSPARAIEEIAQGERAILKYGPWEIGTGKKAADVVDKLVYGDYSPLRPLRKLFDHRVKGALEGDIQRVLDVAYSEREDLLGWARSQFLKLDETRRNLSEVLKDVVDYADGIGEPGGFLDTFAREIIENRYSDKAINEFAQSTLRAIKDPARVNEVATHVLRYADMVERTTDAVWRMSELMGIPVKKYKDLWINFVPRRKAGIPGAYKILAARRDLLRDIPGGSQSIQRISTDPLYTSILTRPKKMRDELFLGLLKARGLPTQGVKGWDRRIARELLARDLKLDVVADDFIMARTGKNTWTNNLSRAAKMARQRGEQMEIAYGSLLRKYHPKIKKAKSEIQFRLPKDAGYGGMRVDVPSYKHLQYAARELGVPNWHVLRRKMDMDRMVRYFGRLPEETLKTGLFDRDLVGTLAEYTEAMIRHQAGALAVIDLATDKRLVRKGRAGVALDTLLDEMGLSRQAIQAVARKFGVPEEQLGELKVHPRVAKAMGRLYKLHTDSRGVGKFRQTWRNVTRFVQQNLTLPFLGYHNRNLAGGLLQNVAGGAFSVRGVTKSLDLWKLRSGPMWDELHRFGVVRPGQSRMIDPVVDAARSRNPLRAFEEQPAGGASLKEALRELVTPAGLKGVVEEQLSPVAELLPERLRKRVGLKGVTEVEPSAITKAGSAVNDFVEFVLRASGYITLRDKGFSPAQAAEKVKQLQFDYREMSPFVRDTLRDWFMFTNFATKNLALQAKLLLSEPGGVTAQTIRGLNRLSEAAAGDYVPPWLRERTLLTSFEGDKPGDRRFLWATNLLPVQEALGRFAVGPDLPGTMFRTLEKHAAQLNPLPLTLVESLTGRQAWSGRGLWELGADITGSPIMDLALYKTPWSRFIATARMLTDPETNLPEKVAAATMGSVHVSNVPVERTKLFEAKQLLEEQLRHTGKVRELPLIYKPKTVEGDPETDRLMDLYRAINSMIRQTQ